MARHCHHQLICYNYNNAGGELKCDFRLTFHILSFVADSAAESLAYSNSRITLASMVVLPLTKSAID